MARLRRTARKSVPGGPYRVEGFRFPEQRVLEVCDNEKRAEVASVCWSVWKARNDFVWNKNYTRLNVVIAKARQFLLQWNIAQKNKQPSRYPNLVEGDGNELWVAPQIEYMKISADAALFSEYNASVLALIARDDHGDLVKARTQYLPGMVSSIMAEALAIKEVLSWIKSKGWRKVVVESDCLTAIQAIRSKTPMVSPLGKIATNLPDSRDSHLSAMKPEKLDEAQLLFLSRAIDIVLGTGKRDYFFMDKRTLEDDVDYLLDRWNNT
ncbi:hypothetical protein AgCh_037190, partial [Apium graveolens]